MFTYGNWKYRLTLLLLALSGWALANPTTGAGHIGG